MQVLCRERGWEISVRTIRFRGVHRSGFEKSCSVGGKLSVECLGHRPWFSVSYRPAIQSGCRHDFHRRVAEKTFVRKAKGVDIELSLLNGDLCLAGQGENDVPRDSVKDTAGERGRAKPACGDKEYIADGAFGEV